MEINGLVLVPIDDLRRIIGETFDEKFALIADKMNIPVFEKQELGTKEVVREYEVSTQTLWKMRLDVNNPDNIKFRKGKDWEDRNGRIVYYRAALNRELVRRVAKANVRDFKQVA